MNQKVDLIAYGWPLRESLIEVRIACRGSAIDSWKMHSILIFSQKLFEVPPSVYIYIYLFKIYFILMVGECDSIL